MPDQLADDDILAAIERARLVACGPLEPRCFALPDSVETVLASEDPDGWVLLGWVVADGGRRQWEAFLNRRTGEGRLRKRAG